MCQGSPSCSPCVYCTNGRQECDNCYGLGFVQRICRDCIEDHYRRQGSPRTVSKVKDQWLGVAQQQFSKSMVTLANALQHNTSLSTSSSTASSSSSSLKMELSNKNGSNNSIGQESDSDESACSTAFGSSGSISGNNIKSNSKSSFRSAASKVVKVTTSVFSGHPSHKSRRSSDDGIRSASLSGKNGTHQRKSSWSSSHSVPSTSIAA
ncbi:hypothetical protein BGX34_010018 [Mortierella sp. NVP85]|nr:hypothetical protein BGX34_010018 [Mortierella sp. NVP85]